jgi:TonB-linked SusC/RagA family outer membrane protein
MKNKPPDYFYRYILTVLFFLLINLDLISQTVTGLVTSAEDGMPLPGVNVNIKGTNTGTITDLNGKYLIQVTGPDNILVFTFTGMEPFEIMVGENRVIDVIMQTSDLSLNEVVVIGYGTVKKSDLTGSVSTVKSEELTKMSTSNAIQSLQGKVAGVQITSTSGAPGADPVIRVRGVGTFNNNAPIFVVDGVIINDISFLNSSDIASMEVLKDASATAIYGSRGSNGVFIITTKSGSAAKDGISINYSGEFGMQFLAKKIDLLTGREFAIIANEIQPGSYNNVDLVPNTDWQDLVYNPAPMHSHQISFAGSTEKSVYYFGLSYFGQDGIVEKSKFERISLKINNTYHLLKNLNIGNNFTISPYKQQYAPNVTYAVYRAQPLLVPYYEDGSFGVVYNVGNPLADLANSNSFGKGIRAVGNIFADWTIFKSVTLRSSFGIDGAYQKSYSFTPPYTVYNPDGTASQQNIEKSNLFKGRNDNLTWLWENTVSFNKSFNLHSFNAVAGFTMQQSQGESLGISGQNLIRNYQDFWYINPINVYDPSNNVNTVGSIFNGVGDYYSMMSFLGRINYTFNNRYIITTTYRQDGSSKFIKRNRFSGFPSFAAGWNISNEEFMKNIPWISNLKLRGSWGMIGNEKISYLDQYSLINNYIAVFGSPDKANSAATYGVSGNDQLVWESTEQLDIGLEFGLFDNKLSGEFDYYRRVTKDILVGLTVPGYQGNGNGARITYNAAEVLNSGIEANLRWRQKINDFSYSIEFVGSFLHNEVLTIGGSQGVDSILIGGYIGDGRTVTLSREGLPIGAFYGYKTDGVFQDIGELNAYPHNSQAGVGDLRFVDVNKDGVINSLDRTYLGSPIPKFVYGFNLSMDYLGFDFSLDMQGQYGNKIFNAKEIVRPDPYNFEKHVFERWTGPGTSNTEPRPSWGGYNYSVSDKFIQDGSFLRIRTVMLGYNFPENLTQSLKIRKLRIYMKVNNLFTFTKFTGYTPEIASQDALSNAIDYGIYPVTAIYSFGLNLTF